MIDTLPLDIEITKAPEYDEENEQYIGSCRINGVDHHITLFRVVEDDHEQGAASGHASRFDALQDFEDETPPFRPVAVDEDGKEFLCVITPHAV